MGCHWDLKQVAAARGELCQQEDYLRTIRDVAPISEGAKVVYKGQAPLLQIEINTFLGDKATNITKLYLHDM